MDFLYWLNKGLDIAKLVAGPTPIGAGIAIVDAVVNSLDDGVSTQSVKNSLVSMSKSKWNGLNPEKLDRINSILDEK